MWAVVFFACAPLAALFQVGYAESLFLLWLFLSLWLVMKRRFGWLYLLIPLMGFTRPGVLAFGLFLGLFGIWRWVSRRREPLAAARDRPHRRAGTAGRRRPGSHGRSSPASSPATRAPTSRPNSPGGGTGWATPVRASSRSTASCRAPASGSSPGGSATVTGYIVLAASVAGVAALLLFEPHVRRMGVESRLWSASYLALSARGVLPPVEHLPPAAAALADVGGRCDAALEDLADRRAGSVSARPVVVDLQHVCARATRTGRSRESGAGRRGLSPVVAAG